MFNKMERNIGSFLCKGGNCSSEYDRIVIAYIEYYHMRARKCKVSFYAVSLVKLILLGVIPVLQVMGKITDLPWLITAFSSGIFFLEACIGLFRLQEKWILYRNTCNRLLSVQRQYGGTQGSEPDSKTLEYIAAVEAIIGEEARQWVELSRDNKEEKQSNTHDEKEK